LACLYWEGRAEGFNDLRGKLFSEALIRLLFTGIENVNVSYSTTGSDSYLDRWGYIQEGPAKKLSGLQLDCNEGFNHNLYNTSEDKYRTVLKNSDNIAFDLKLSSQKVTPDVSVTIGNDLVLIAEVAGVCGSECEKLQQLHTQMLLSLDRHRTLFGMLVQGHQVYLAEYTYDPASGYKRQCSQKAFKYQKENLRLLYSYLQTHFMSKDQNK
jgi:hypothetical protein